MLKNILTVLLSITLTTSALAIGTVTGGKVPSSKSSSTFRTADGGVPLLGVRNDADVSRTTADGQYVPINTDSTGRLKITGAVSATLAEQAVSPSGSSTTITSLYKMVAGVDLSGIVHPVRTSTVGEVIIYAPTLPLPTGAATETTAASGASAVVAINGKMNSLGQKTGANSMPVVLASDQGGLPLSTGAATEATLGAVNASVNTLGASVVAMSTSVYQIAGGLSPVDHIRYSYASASVVTSAYTQVDASMGGLCNEVDIFDSSGQTLLFATGGVGVEVDQIYVVPGGNGRLKIAVPSGVRTSLKAVSNPATAGEFDLNCYR